MNYKNFISLVKNIYKKEDFIPLHRPIFEGNEKKYLAECVDSNFVSSAGKMIEVFESKIAEYTGNEYGIAVSNGTSALHVALKLAGVDNNTEVITQSLSFIATANAISYCGASPIFLDVDRDSMGLSPSAVENFINANTEYKNGELINTKTNKKITACVPMHTFGNSCRIDELEIICQKYGIPLIEDAAESLGSFFKEKHTGKFGLMGVFSFNGNKIMTTGGGGMIVTNNKEIAIKAKHITTTSKTPHPYEFIHDEIGFNYRMPNLNAALGLAQVERLQNFLVEKKKVADIYIDFCSNNNMDYAFGIKDSSQNYWLNAIILNNLEERDNFLKITNDQGVMTRPVWKLLSTLEMYSECYSDGLENSKWLEERLVNIPSSVPFS